MKVENFYERIEEIDQQLNEQDVPVHARTFPAFQLLAPYYQGYLTCSPIEARYFGEYEGPNLLQKIDDWFKNRYGNRFNAPTDLGRIPLQIRGQVFLARIPLVFGKAGINPLKLIEEVTNDLLNSLSSSELCEIVHNYKEGYALYYEIDRLLGISDPRFPGLYLQPLAAEFIHKAIRDREAATRCLCRNSDLNNACFHSQQFAEKMMKAFIVQKRGYTTEQEVKSFGHNIKELFEGCVKESPTFSTVANDVRVISNIRMDFRYSVPEVPLSSALEAFWSALRIAGFTACQQSGLNQRFQVSGEDTHET